VTVARSLKSLVLSVAAVSVSAGTASAQITIANVYNAASRQINSGIAQGALFVVQGRGVGTSDNEQATFPLPTTTGLGGVTIQVNSGGQSYDAIIVYTKPNEIGAILPSTTPTGPATLTVTNNGVSATKAMNVVDAAFGIFTQKYGIGAGLALAFNVNGDGSTAPNSTTLSVKPGQDVLINGTGLGAITSDETQPGATDVPATSAKVYLGIQAATVVSAGRGTCCDGIDPDYPVPQGIAAWDVVRFTVPDGVTGCYIPVAVQIGKTVSNLATISIDPGGAACVPTATGLPQDLSDKLANQTGLSVGNVGLGRTIAMNVNNQGAVVTTRRDGGSAAFVSYPGLPASVATAQNIYPNNVCSINGWPGANGPGSVDQNGNTITINPLKSVPFDAGTPIVVKGPGGSRNIVKRTVGQVFDYPGVNFGDTTAGNFFDPGHYTVTDAAGGKDVGAFNGAIDVGPAHFVWTNIPDVKTPIDRSQDLVIQWTGGAPGSQVTVTSAALANGVATAFQCAAPVSAGQITVPSYILLQLPSTVNAQLGGQLVVDDASVTVFTASGLDLGTVRYTDGYSLAVRFQ